MKDEPPEILFEDDPDPTERTLRMGCGALVGLVMAVVLGIRLWPSAIAFVAMAVASMALCAWLASRYGDEFFRDALKWLRWW